MIRGVLAKWDRFWFEPFSSTPIAIYRILHGLLVLQLIFVHLWPDALSWYGPTAVYSPESTFVHFWNREPLFNLLSVLPSHAWTIHAFFAVFALAALSQTLGVRTRISCLTVFLCLVSLHHACPVNINAGDVFMRLTSLFLSLSNAGDSLSIDSLRNRSQVTSRSEKSQWATRLIQLQLNIVYLHAFYTKSIGLCWQNGSAVYYAVRLDDFTRFPLPPLLDQSCMLQALTWMTLVIEFALGCLVWFRPFRYWILLLGVALHLGIDYALNLPMFEWLMITALVVYVYPKHLDDLLSRLTARFHYFRALIVKSKRAESTTRNHQSNLAFEWLSVRWRKVFALAGCCLAGIAVISNMLNPMNANAFGDSSANPKQKFFAQLGFSKEELRVLGWTSSYSDSASAITSRDSGFGVEGNEKSTNLFSSRHPLSGAEKLLCRAAGQIMSALERDKPEEREVDAKLRLLRKLADGLWQCNSYPQAEKIFRYIWLKRYSLAVSSQHHYDPELHNTMIGLASLYRDWGQFQMSEGVYQTAMNYGLHDQAYPDAEARDRLNLAVTFYLDADSTVDATLRTAKLAFSESLYREALSEFIEREGQDAPVVSVIENNLLLVRRDRDAQRAKSRLAKKGQLEG